MHAQYLSHWYRAQRKRQTHHPHRHGNLWVTANELNALATVTPAGQVRTAARNDSRGPLEFPAAMVFTGGVGYVANFDTPPRVNLDANGKTALDGIGASIARLAH